LNLDATHLYPEAGSGLTLGKSTNRFADVHSVDVTASGTVQAEHLYSTDDIVVDDAFRNDGAFLGAYEASAGASFFQNSGAGENRYLTIYGDVSGVPEYIRTRMQNDGNAILESEGGLILRGAGSTFLQAQAVGAHVYIDLGGTLYVRDYDDSNANRMTLDSATGDWWIAGDGDIDGDLNVDGAAVVDGSLTLGEYIYHQGDADTYLRFETDAIGLTAGGVSYLSIASSKLTFPANAYLSEYLYHSGDVDTYWQFTPDRIRGSAGGTVGIDLETNLTLSPAGDVILDPAGNDVLPATGYDINLGSLPKKYLTLHAAELWVETLVAQDTIATIGGRVLVGPTTTLTSDLGSGATTIYVKHNQMVSGDRVYMEADGKVEFMAVTGGPTGTGPYAYTVTRNLDGTGANDWYAGDAVFNTGAAGDGFIDLYSYSGVTSGTTGPTIVGNVRNSTIYNDWTEHWAIGNLNGIYGYGTDTYGVGLGKYSTTTAYITIDATNGYRIHGSDYVVAQWDNDGDIHFYDSDEDERIFIGDFVEDTDFGIKIIDHGGLWVVSGQASDTGGWGIYLQDAGITPTVDTFNRNAIYVDWSDTETGNDAAIINAELATSGEVTGQIAGILLTVGAYDEVSASDPRYGYYINLQGYTSGVTHGVHSIVYAPDSSGTVYAGYFDANQTGGGGDNPAGAYGLYADGIGGALYAAGDIYLHTSTILKCAGSGNDIGESGTRFATVYADDGDFSDDLTVGDQLNIGDNIVFTGSYGLITTNTSDGSDTKYLAIAGGGAVGNTRGADFYLYGNEHGSHPGRVFLRTGAIVGAYMEFEINGTKFWMDEDKFYSDSDHDLGRAADPFGTAYVAGVDLGTNTITDGNLTGAWTGITNLTATGTIQAEHLYSTDDIEADGDLDVAGDGQFGTSYVVNIAESGLATGANIYATSTLYFGTTSNHQVRFYTNDVYRWAVDNDGTFFPGDAAYDIGKSGDRVGTIYSQDIDLLGDLTVGDDAYWADGGRAYFGSDDDMAIYHDGSNAHISNGTGTLHVNYTAEGDVQFFAGATSGENPVVKMWGYDTGESAARYGQLSVLTNGWFSVEAQQALLLMSAAATSMYFRAGGTYYWQDRDDSDANRMTLNSATGDLWLYGDLDVDGDLNVDGAAVIDGALTIGGYIYHQGDLDTYLRFQTDQVDLCAGGSVFLSVDTDGVSAAGGQLYATRDADETALFHTETAAANTILTGLTLRRAVSSGNGAVGLGMALDFDMENDAGGSVTDAARILATWTDASQSSEDSQIEFWTYAGGSGNKAMYVTSDGKLYVDASTNSTYADDKHPVGTFDEYDDAALAEKFAKRTIGGWTTPEDIETLERLGILVPKGQGFRGHMIDTSALFQLFAGGIYQNAYRMSSIERELNQAWRRVDQESARREKLEEENEELRGKLESFEERLTRLEKAA